MISLTRLRHGRTLAAAVLLVPAAFAQHDDQSKPKNDEEAQAEPVFSLNISPLLLRQGIDLLVEKRLTKDYGLDEYQAEEVRLLLHERLPQFLAEHQAELETLMTEWLEAASAAEPPTAEFAADWATRLRPIVEEAELLVDGLTEDMSEFLNDDQQVLLEGFHAGIHAATRTMKGRLYEFEQGHFDPAKHWVRNREVRRRGPEDIKRIRRQMDEARRQASLGYAYDDELVERPVPPPRRPSRATTDASASARPKHELVEHQAPAASPSDSDSTPEAFRSAKPAGKKVEKDEWTLYVEAFIKRYQLNDEQRQKAQQFLQRAHAQRDRHLSGKGSEMERITNMFNNAKDEKQRATAQKAYDSFQRPMTRMFERLKGKLETLPTRGQRRAAATSTVKLPEPGKPAEQAPANEHRPK